MSNHHLGTSVENVYKFHVFHKALTIEHLWNRYFRKIERQRACWQSENCRHKLTKIGAIVGSVLGEARELRLAGGTGQKISEMDGWLLTFKSCE